MAVLYLDQHVVIFRDLAVAHADGGIGSMLLKISRSEVLVLDDFAMAAVTFWRSAYCRPKMVLTTGPASNFETTRNRITGMVRGGKSLQVPLKHWHEQIGPTPIPA